MSESESVPEPGHVQHAFPHADLSGAVPTSTEARAKRRIAALEEELQMIKEERGTKQRSVMYRLTAQHILIAYKYSQEDHVLRRSRQGYSSDGRPLY